MSNFPPLSGHRPGTAVPGDGAFAVPSSVTWEDGLGDDDLEVVAPEPSAVPARPSLPTRSLRRTPVASPVPAAPAPVVQVPAVPAPVVQAPVVQAPVVQAPVVQAPVVQVPAAPAPVAVPTDVDTASAEPSLAAPTRIRDTDFTAPAWTRIIADKEDEPASDGWDATAPPSFVVPSVPTTPAPTVAATAATVADQKIEGPAPRRSLLTRSAKPGKKVTATKRKASAASPNGRGAWLALRITIGVITAWLLIVGLKHVVIGSTVPTTDQLATQVATKMGFNGFPRAAGEAFAARFASVYLTYNQAGNDKRTQELSRYAPNATTLSWGWDGSGKQSVVQGPVVAGDPELLDKNNAIVTVAAKLSGGSWVYLAIPVYSNDAGALSISGPPAYTSAPRLATSPGKEAIQDLDGQLAALINPDMVGFLTAWAASEPTALSRYTTTDATVAATTGLGGAFTLKDLRGLRIPSAGGDTRQGEADVVWSVPGGGQMLQSYRLVFEKLATGRWFVKDIKGGLIGPASTGGLDPSVSPSTPAK